MKKVCFHIAIAFFALSFFCMVQSARAQSVTIDASTKFQTMQGFGADFDQTYANSQAVIDLGYKPYPIGIGLIYARVAMTWDQQVDAGCGLTYPPCVGDWTNAQEIAADGGRVWAVGDTAPAAWKSNNSLTCGGSLLVGHYQDYANEILSFINTAKSNGVPLYGFSVQNEPDGSSCAYPAMSMGSNDMRNFIDSALGPTLAGSGTQIIAPDTIEPTTMWDYISAFDSTALGFIGVFSTHGYGAGPIAPQRTDHPIWDTEWFPLGSDHGIGAGMSYANAITDGIVTGGETQYTPFRYATGSSGEEQLIFKSGTSDTPLKTYYAMGQFSAFVRPGTQRVAVNNSVSGVRAVGFVDSNGSPVLVLINNNGGAVNVPVSGFNASSATPYITDASRSLAQQSDVSVSGGSLSYAVPGNSVTTFVASGGPTPTPTPTPTSSGVVRPRFRPPSVRIGPSPLSWLPIYEGAVNTYG